jgi:hypothetical protein
MTSTLFAITRKDGRSNSQVVVDYVRDSEPGRLFTYDELAAALSVGSDRGFTARDVCQAVRGALLRLLREQQRRLHNVRLVGYRLAPAIEHRRLARQDHRRADVQLRRGLETLRNVRWNELDPNARLAHEGTLMLTESLYINQLALDRRMRTIEDAIEKVKK